jgi:small subunit ribosomal protein S5
MVNVTIVDGTVPYDIKAKFKAAQVMVHPASEGT